MTTTETAKFEQFGRQAHANGDMAAPALNAEVMAAVSNLPVGTGAAEIMKAFSRGYQAAIDDELRRLGF